MARLIRAGGTFPPAILGAFVTADGTVTGAGIGPGAGQLLTAVLAPVLGVADSAFAAIISWIF